MSSLTTAAILGAAESWGATRSWQVASGDWSAASNWGGTVPTASDTTLVVNGGTVDVTLLGETCGTLSLGSSAGSGTLLMTAGSLATVSNELIGFSGAGAFTLSGGTNTISGSLVLAQSAGAAGTYNLNAGLLSLSGLTQGAGSAAFNFSGGTLQAGATFSSSVPIALSQSGNDDVFNTNGKTLTLSGVLSGPGGLQKIGAGTLTMSGSNVYTGDTVVSAGTLQVIGGQLPAATEYVGSNGAASLVQSGGTNAVSSALNFGYNSGDSGTYNLGGSGLLSTPYEYIGVSGTGSFTQTGGTHAVSSELDAGYGVGSSGTYNLSGSGLLSAPYESIGWFGTGNFTQSGGTHSVTNELDVGYSGSSGTYSLNGSGLLSALNEYIGNAGTGIFTQSGGTHTVSSVLGVGYGGGSGTYNLGSSSLLTVAAEYIGDGGTGAFIQTGGTHTLSSNLYLGYNSGDTGTYNLSGAGPLSARAEYIGFSGSGSFTQLGGTHAVPVDLYLGFNSGGSGSYTLNGGSLAARSEYVGFSGSGSFTQSGGTHAVAFNLDLGGSPTGNGTYNLSGSGLLSVPFEYVGNSGIGYFGQSGGTHAVAAELDIGYAGGSGTYSLGGAGLLSAATEYIGNGGSGFFTQTGGTNTISAGLVLAPNAASAGTYNLNGGLLVLSGSGLVQGAGNAAFNFSGGTFQAASSLSTSFPIVLSAAGSNGVFDSHGNALTLAGPISGPGGLQKIGAGTLTLSVSNACTGTTLVSGGTLLLADPNAISGSTFDTTGTGSLSFGALTTANFGGLQGCGNLALNNSSSVGVSLSVGGDGANTTFSGGLSGNGSLTMLGSGTFTVTGSNSYSGNTTLSAGTLQILAGQLPAATEYVGSNGAASLVQSGGNNAVSSCLYVGNSSGGSGTYNLSGNGLLSAPTEYIGSGSGGYGSVTQSGAIHAVAGSLYLGSGNGSSGSYNLSGSGLLSAASEYFGYIWPTNLWNAGASGSFTQSGGTNAVAGTLILGDNVGGYYYSGYGTYNLSGSGLLTAATEYMGYDYNSQGTFTQAGGTNAIAGNLVLGQGAGSRGTYNLNGGLLTLSGLVQGGGNCAFNVYGGTLQAGSSFSTNVPISINTLGSNGFTIDTNGNTLTLSGSIQAVGFWAVGILQKTGSGTLILSAANNYSGTRLLGGSIDFFAGGLGGEGVQVDPGSGNSAWLIWGGGNNTTDLTSGPYNGLTLASGTTGFDLQGQTVTFGATQNGTAIAGSGALSIANGTLVFGDYSGLGSGPVALVNNGAGVGFLAFNRSSGTNVVANAIGGVGGLSQTGSDTLVLTSANTYTGGTSVLAGCLQLGHSNAVQNSTVNVLADNGLQFSPGIGTFNLGGLAGANLLTLNDTASVAVALSVGGHGLNTTYSGAIGGNGGLTIVGSATLTLTGPNTYAGSTTVNGGTLQMPSGALSSQYQYIGYGGTGSFAQSGGTNSVSASSGGLYLGFNSGSSGTYQLSGGGLLSANNSSECVAIHGTGALVQSGGTNSLANSSLNVGGVPGGSGTYTLSGGLLSANSSYEGVWSGTFLQSGGTNAVAGSSGSGIGVAGSYILSGGLLSINRAANEYVTGTVMQTGGTCALAPYTVLVVSGGGTYSLSGSGLLTADSTTQVNVGGGSGLGVLTQSGGTCLLNMAASLYIGYMAGDNGTYNLSSGLLSANSGLEVVGERGTGTFAQSGGTNSLTGYWLSVGDDPGSNGAYNLSGSGLLSANNVSEYVGYSGAGTFTRSGGVNSFTGNGSLILGAYSGSSGI